MLTLFKAQGAKTVRKWTPRGLLETPYKRASQEWDDRMGSALVQAYHWRLACFALAAEFAIQTIGIIYLGSLPKAVTHIVQVDRLGGARYFGPATSAPFLPGPESVKYYLRQFVHHTRSLTSDAEVLKTWWVIAYKVPHAGGEQRPHGPTSRRIVPSPAPRSSAWASSSPT